MKVFISKNPFPNRIMVFDGSAPGKISLDQPLQLIFYDGKITLKIFKSFYMKDMDVYFVVQNLEYFLLKMRPFRNIIYKEIENKEGNTDNDDSKLNKIFGWKKEFGIDRGLYLSVQKYKELEKKFKEEYQKGNCKEHKETSRKKKIIKKKGQMTNDFEENCEKFAQITDNKGEGTNRCLNDDTFLKSSNDNEISKLQRDECSQLASMCYENASNHSNGNSKRLSVNLDINENKPIFLQNTYRGIELSFMPKMLDSIRSSLSNSHLYQSEEMPCHLIFKILNENDLTLDQIEKQLGFDVQNTLKSMIFTKIVLKKGDHFTLNSYFKDK